MQRRDFLKKTFISSITCTTFTNNIFSKEIFIKGELELRNEIRHSIIDKILNITSNVVLYGPAVASIYRGRSPKSLTICIQLPSSEILKIAESIGATPLPCSNFTSTRIYCELDNVILDISNKIYNDNNYITTFPQKGLEYHFLTRKLYSNTSEVYSLLKDQIIWQQSRGSKDVPIRKFSQLIEVVKDANKYDLKVPESFYTACSELDSANLNSLEALYVLASFESISVRDNAKNDLLYNLEKTPLIARAKKQLFRV